MKKIELGCLTKINFYVSVNWLSVTWQQRRVILLYTISMYHWLLLLKNPTILLDNEKLEKRKNKTTSSILPSFNQSRCFPLINRPISFASDYHVTPSTYVHMPPTFDVIADNFLQSKFLSRSTTFSCFLFHIVCTLKQMKGQQLSCLLFQSSCYVV